MIISIIETKVAILVQSLLTAIAEPEQTAVVESRLKALVQAKLEPITAQTGDTFTTLSRRIDTGTAIINELKSRLTNFMARVKNNCITHGDFNAAHTAWGYVITAKKGSRVHDAAQQHGLTLWNDPLQPTRVGKSVARGTNPDHTFTREVKKAGSTCLPDMFGSDHHIIQLDILYEHRPTETGTTR
ncbi:hypothetical protein HPB52_004372 [Rhipicephalus sanguineus]|uniref:Endonuclease/exonuclease/phosphatase domain-containing protein n=1 Tax=Rhipicephalus sanguineus TaxID=34632 RepID=A0A9D4T3T2_RHISA|nr:hypothetical protein HPB52_004372 [Rhipicephalus sanguineus]